MTVHAASYICMYMYHTAPLLRPYFQEIEGGRNNEDLRFRLTVKPPPPPPPPLQSICVTVIDRALLRGRSGELLRSTCSIILKDGGVVGHVHVPYCLAVTPCSLLRPARCYAPSLYFRAKLLYRVTCILPPLHAPPPLPRRPLEPDYDTAVLARVRVLQV